MSVFLFYLFCLLVPPLKVDISKVETRFVAGESSEIRCQTFGSRPAASISWWKDNVRLSDSSYKVKRTRHSRLPVSRWLAYARRYSTAFVRQLLSFMAVQSRKDPTLIRVCAMPGLLRHNFDLFMTASRYSVRVPRIDSRHGSPFQECRFSMVVNP